MKKSKNYVLRIISDIPLLICSRIPHNNCWIYELNEIGKLIWEICDSFETEDDLVRGLDRYFLQPLSLEQKNDVKEYLRTIKEKGLVWYER